MAIKLDDLMKTRGVKDLSEVEKAPENPAEAPQELTQAQADLILTELATINGKIDIIGHNIEVIAKGLANEDSIDPED